MAIRAVVFDMDDTLYHEKDYVISGFKAVDNFIKDQFQVDGFFETAIIFFDSGQRGLIFNKTLSKLGIECTGKLIRDLVNHYREHRPKIQLLDDARWILHHLTNEVKLGLISDGYLISQQQKVIALKINHLFHSIILSDIYGKEHWKPSHLPYEAVSKELCLQHHECVYIGDNAAKDFIGAKRLGWKTVQINRENGLYSNVRVDQEYEADFQVNNLKEIKDLPILEHLIKEGCESLK